MMHKNIQMKCQWSLRFFWINIFSLSDFFKIFFEGTLGWVLKLSSNSLGPPGCEALAAVPRL